MGDVSMLERDICDWSTVEESCKDQLLKAMTCLSSKYLSPLGIGENRAVDDESILLDSTPVTEPEAQHTYRGGYAYLYSLRMPRLPQPI